MSKEKEEPTITEEQVSIKEKLTAIGCDLTFDEDSTWSISPNDNWRNSELGTLLDILPQAQFITRLNLNGQGIETKEAIALAKGLKGTNITTLGLNINHIGREGAEALAKGLKGTNITTLEVGSNKLGVEGTIALAKGLKDTNITTLNLEGNQIGNKGTEALAVALKDTNITTLSLRCNQIENEGAIALATHLQGTNITTLNLDYNDIGREGAESLVKNLQNTSIIMVHSLSPSGSRLKYTKLECIKAHQETLSESVSKFIKENGSVSTKMLSFYINTSKVVLQNYLKGIYSEYTVDDLLEKSKEITKNIDKFLSRVLLETFIPDLGKLIVEYCGRDFELTPKMYKQLLPTPLDTTIEVVKDEEALTKALTSSLHGREVITPGDWVPRSINSGSHSSSSSTSTMSSSEMAYSDSVSSSSSYSSSNSYSMSSYYESTLSTTDISLSGAYEAISDSQGV